jgi:hypothetical protein
MSSRKLPASRLKASDSTRSSVMPGSGLESPLESRRTRSRSGSVSGIGCHGETGPPARTVQSRRSQGAQQLYDRLVYYGSLGGGLRGAADALPEREKLWSGDAAEKTRHRWGGSGSPAGPRLSSATSQTRSCASSTPGISPWRRMPWRLRRPSATSFPTDFATRRIGCRRRSTRVCKAAPFRRT